jgi:hypothetical protein
MSFDKYLESICPTIVFTLTQRLHAQTVILPSNTNTLIALINRIIRAGHGIGFIFMENLSTMQTVLNAFSSDNSFSSDNAFSSDNSLSSDNASVDLITNITNGMMSSIQTSIFDNYLFELCRLWRLGYIHGDTHLSNAMFIPHTNYIDGYRVYLIDFGLTTPVNDDINLTNVDIMQKNIYSILNIKGINYVAYQPLQTYVDYITGGNALNFLHWFTNMTNKRLKSKINFLQNRSSAYTTILNTLRPGQYNDFDNAQIPPNIPIINFRNASKLKTKISTAFIVQNLNRGVYEFIEPNILLQNINNLIFEMMNIMVENQHYFDNKIPDIDGIYNWVLYYKNNELKMTFF